MKDNFDILFTRADKGNITVAMDQSSYFDRMHELLNVSDTYLIVQRNPINKILYLQPAFIIKKVERSRLYFTIYL